MRVVIKGFVGFATKAAMGAICVLTSAGCSAPGGEDTERLTSAIGSTEPPQDINDWDGLTQMTATGNYVLKVNLNAAGKTWTPKDFRGTFDGGGKTISNLTVNTASDPNGAPAGLFATLDSAIVRNLKLTGLAVTARSHGGGVAGTAGDSLIELVSVQGTIATSGAAGISVGGIVGTGANVKIDRCAVKGTVRSALRYAGGIAGYLNAGDNRSEVSESYAWVTVAPDTTDPSRAALAGGIVGWLFGGTIRDVYAVGDVTGRERVGGLVGSLTCDDGHPFVLNHGIYRGEVIDKSRSGGWAGTFGTYENCTSRFDQLIWDRSADLSTVWGTRSPEAQKSATRQELMSPTTPGGGTYAYADNTFTSAIWEAGDANQHHALKNAAGGVSVQPRCVVNGVPTAC